MSMLSYGQPEMVAERVGPLSDAWASSAEYELGIVHLFYLAYIRISIYEKVDENEMSVNVIRLLGHEEDEHLWHSSYPGSTLGEALSRTLQHLLEAELVPPLWRELVNDFLFQHSLGILPR